MKALKNAIETRGHFINDEVLKVDAFLNHQIDCSLVDEMGNEFYEHFKNKGITKVVTIESSGIAPAYATAIRLNVPLIFIKKTQPSTMIDPAFAEVFSFTKNKTYPICIEKEYLKKGDKVLFIDDFLANGEAFKGTENLIAQAQAEIVGVGMVIEKAFQKGHAYITEKGYDKVEFMISTNPGESLKPLGKIVSGGELSRIMLAIKAILADKDQIDTLIFDEIDTGISGRTAQKVSEKMAVIGQHRQVLCITHLPQIAAMADTHFEIEKHVEGTETITQIHPLEGEESVRELARLLGGAEITPAVLGNAREMKELAQQQKNTRLK